MPSTKIDSPNKDWQGRTSTERAAYLGYLLAKGGEYTSMEVAKKLGYRHRISAINLLNKIAGVLPLVRTGHYHNGKWHLMKDE